MLASTVHISRYLLFILLFFTIACQPTNELDKDQTKADIMEVISAQEKGWNEGDLEQYMQGYYLDDSLRFASGGNVSYGWKNTLLRYQKGYPDPSVMGKLQFSDIDIQILGSDAALVFGKWKLYRDADQPWGLFSLVFRKTDAGWRIVHDHTSSAD